MVITGVQAEIDDLVDATLGERGEHAALHQDVVDSVLVSSCRRLRGPRMKTECVSKEQVAGLGKAAEARTVVILRLKPDRSNSRAGYTADSCVCVEEDCPRHTVLAMGR